MPVVFVAFDHPADLGRASPQGAVRCGRAHSPKSTSQAGAHLIRDLLTARLGLDSHATAAPFLPCQIIYSRFPLYSAAPRTRHRRSLEHSARPPVTRGTGVEGEEQILIPAWNHLLGRFGLCTLREAPHQHACVNGYCNSETGLSLVHELLGCVPHDTLVWLSARSWRDSTLATAWSCPYFLQLPGS